MALNLLKLQVNHSNYKAPNWQLTSALETVYLVVSRQVIDLRFSSSNFEHEQKSFQLRRRQEMSGITIY